MTRDEFEYFLNTFETQLYSLCIRLTRNREEANDLFQDTWLAAMEQLDQISLSKNAKSYLFGKSIQIWKNKKRKYARRERIAPTIHVSDELESICLVSHGATPESNIIDKEMIECLNLEINSLKYRHRIVVELYYSLDLSTSEIAGILHIPQGTVESRLYKARKLLQKKNGGTWV